MPKLRVEMKVEKVTMELPDTKTLQLKWPEDYDVNFLTGQFITLIPRPALSQLRHFSILPFKYSCLMFLD